MKIDTRSRCGADSGQGYEMAKPSEDEKRRAVRAEEWRQFRRDFLYSQSNLADALRCSRRTVVSVECGETLNPHPSLLKRLLNLKRKEERAASEAA
jgi:DNA-binding XRE family transcriptional regulator